MINQYEQPDQGNSIQTPDIDPATGQIRRKAIKNADQAFGIAKSLERANRVRDAKNAKIEAKYSGSAPFNQKKLTGAGQSWRNNINTRFMATFIDRKVPEFVTMVESAQVLTNAELPTHWPDATIKNQKFRRRFTDLVRSWQEWRDFVTQVAQENFIFGYAVPACTDPYDWRPELFTQSNFYVPDNSAQTVDKLQVLILRKDFLINEAVEKIADSDNAELAGWNTYNWAMAINNAMPKNRAWSLDESNWREFVDEIRDGSLYESFNSNNRVIQTFDCYFREANGSVTQYMVNYKGGAELFKQEFRYKSMGEVCQLMALTIGNRKLHGSQGAGKILFNFHVAAERNRCMFLDCVNLSSNILMKMKTQDFAKANNLKITVANPFTVVVTDADIVEGKGFTPNAELFAAAEQLLIGLAEASVGTVMPGNSGIEDDQKETATKTNIEAQREAEVKMGVLARFAYQFSNIVTMMQRRACDPETTDQEAQEFQMALMQEDGLTQEEVQLFGNCPAAKSLTDISVLEQQKLTEVSLDPTMAPFLDQNKLADLKTRQKLGDDMADAILLTPQNQQAGEIEQARQQQGECGTMVTTQQNVPVSPRDVHPIHREEIKKQVPALAAVVAQSPNPILINAIELFFQHFEEHINSQMMQGAKSADIAEDAMWLRENVKQFDMIQKSVKEAVTQMTKQPEMPAPIPGGVQPVLQ